MQIGEEKRGRNCTQQIPSSSKPRLLHTNLPAGVFVQKLTEPQQSFMWALSSAWCCEDPLSNPSYDKMQRLGQHRCALKTPRLPIPPTCTRTALPRGSPAGLGTNLGHVAYSGHEPQCPKWLTCAEAWLPPQEAWGSALFSFVFIKLKTKAWTNNGWRSNLNLQPPLINYYWIYIHCVNRPLFTCRAFVS